MCNKTDFQTTETNQGAREGISKIWILLGTEIIAEEIKKKWKENLKNFEMIYSGRVLRK